jgi:hypothetical protein
MECDMKNSGRNGEENLECLPNQKNAAPRGADDFCLIKRKELLYCKVSNSTRRGL